MYFESKIRNVWIRPAVTTSLLRRSNQVRKKKKLEGEPSMRHYSPWGGQTIEATYTESINSII